MVALSADSAGMHEDELLRETLAVFGGRRLTPGITARLRAALQLALRDQRLLAAGNGRLVPATGN